MCVTGQGKVVVVWEDGENQTIVVKRIEPTQLTHRIGWEFGWTYCDSVAVAVTDRRTDVFWVAEEQDPDIVVLIDGSPVAPLFRFEKSTLYHSAIKEDTCETRKLADLRLGVRFLPVVVPSSTDKAALLLVPPAPRAMTFSLAEIYEYQLNYETGELKAETTCFVMSDDHTDLWAASFGDGCIAVLFENVHWNMDQSHVFAAVKRNGVWGKPVDLLVRRGPAIFRQWFATLVELDGRQLIAAAYYDRATGTHAAFFDTESGSVVRCNLTLPGRPLAMVGSKNGELHFACKGVTDTLIYVRAKLPALRGQETGQQ